MRSFYKRHNAESPCMHLEFHDSVYMVLTLADHAVVKKGKKEKTEKQIVLAYYVVLSVLVLL